MTFQRSHPQRGVTNTRVEGKICNFRQITRFISKTVQDRCLISLHQLQNDVSANEGGGAAKLAFRTTC